MTMLTTPANSAPSLIGFAARRGNDSRPSPQRGDDTGDAVMSSLLDSLHHPGDLHGWPLPRLEALAREIRERIIQTVSVNGGHFGGPLGVVELAIALHCAFDFPRDRLIWDVGHQAYPHKLLTGRAGRFHTLRTEGGLSGYPTP